MAKLTRKGATVIFIIIAVLIAIAVIYYLTKDKGCDPNRNGYDKKGNLSSKCKVEDPTSTNTQPPSGTSGWTSDEYFPIKKGSWGPRVSAIQKAIKVESDGKFGSLTESALLAKTGKTQIINKQELDALINPPATGGGYNFGQLKESLKNRSSNISGGIRTYEQGFNQSYRLDFYTNGRLFVYDASNKEVGKGSYSNGGKSVKLDSWGETENLDSTYKMITYLIKEIEKGN